MIGICRLYGKFPFCKNCRYKDVMCDYFYKNMTDKEQEEYKKRMEYKKQVKEMLED